MEEEKWIEGYEGIYSISPDGKVYSYHSGERKEMKQRYNKHRNRLDIRLVVENFSDTRDVHRLVAEYFIPNPNNSKVVEFKDGNTLNVHKDNLRWKEPDLLEHLPSGAKWISGFEGLYYSKNGKVYNKKHKEMSPYGGVGKEKYSLHKNGRKHYYSPHKEGR